MNDLLSFLKNNFFSAIKSLKEVSDGLIDLDIEAISIDALKRYEINNKICGDNISTPDTIGIFKDKIVFIEFKDANKNFFKDKEKRLSLFLKQVDVLILFYLLYSKFRRICFSNKLSFWMVYGKESYRRALRNHFRIYGIDKRYRFIYTTILPVSKDNFLKYLNQGLLKL